MKVRIILVGEAAGLSNLPPLHLWKKTALLNEIDTKSSTQEQLGVGALWLVLSSLVVNRTRRTFTERDRSLLNTLRINISEACEAASRHAVPSASLMMEALEPLVGGSIVTVEASGRLLFCSDHAQKHFETFFTAEKPFIGGLPLTVKKWVRRQNAAFETVELTRRPQPLTVWCGEKNLEIQLASTRDRTCV